MYKLDLITNYFYLYFNKLSKLNSNLKISLYCKYKPP